MKVRILVVDDSAFMRKVISDIINESNDFEVIGTARNGKDAVAKVKELQPDVVTMDVEMPIMDGIEALKKIMDEHPVPVLMLSSLTKEGADATITSLEYGAVDFITKPSSIFKVNTDDMKEELFEKISVASRVRVRSVRRQAPLARPKRPETQKIVRKPRQKAVHKDGRIDKIIAIGTSTGGPRALQSVVPKLPGDINAAVIIVQHMPPGFTKSLAERMDSMSDLAVKEAEDGDILCPGCAYLAPGDKHLRVISTGTSYKIILGSDPPITGHRPSVDAMFYSLADLGSNNVIGVIMTGMGADGAKGLSNVKVMNKAHIIAQDEDSCVVFGMPKSAIAEGVVDRVVPLGEISTEIMKAMGV